jgi:hypothetical protein
MDWRAAEIGRLLGACGGVRPALAAAIGVVGLPKTPTVQRGSIPRAVADCAVTISRCCESLTRYCAPTGLTTRNPFMKSRKSGRAR